MNHREQYFNTDDYLEYLKRHCTLENVDNHGRFVGSDWAASIIKLLDIYPGARTLEIGCGLGRILHLLQECFGADVVGCDVSLKAIEHLKKINPNIADRVYHTPNESLDLFPSRSFDIIVTWGAFELMHQKKALIEMARLLKLKGKALLVGVKNGSYHSDDEESRAAHMAYIEKTIPIFFSNIPKLESLLHFLGFHILKRLVFSYKKDVVQGNYTVDRGGRGIFSEAFYIIEKVDETPMNDEVIILPSEIKRTR